MKKLGLGILITLIGLIALSLGGILTFAQTGPLFGKIIALDAGHGGDELGAQYPANCSGTETKCQIYEKDVNLAVVYALKQKLVGAGATVVLTRECDETISSRKSRVDMAIEECKSLYGRKCDVLVSVHHNGSTYSNYDGLLVIYNEKQDKPLAIALHDALWNEFASTTPNYVDKGLDNGGYGITVYGHLVSALTEAYYITNDWEAQQYLMGTSNQVCSNSNGSDKYVLIGDRVNQEADAQVSGLSNYFSAPPTKPRGRK